MSTILKCSNALSSIVSLTLVIVPLFNIGRYEYYYVIHPTLMLIVIAFIIIMVEMQFIKKGFIFVIINHNY